MCRTSGCGDGLLPRAAARRRRALELVDDLGLLEAWGEIGRAVLCGAVAHDLVVSPDIDVEVYVREQSIDAGFAVLGGLARHPRVRKAAYANHLDGPDQGLYWQLRVVDDDGVEWKLDVWTLASLHSGPRAVDLIDVLPRVLDSDQRRAVLELKEWIAARGSPRPCASVEVYRAVIEGGIRTPDQLEVWAGRHASGGITAWLPPPKPGDPTITLVRNTWAEALTRGQLLRLHDTYDLRPWRWTDDVRIETWSRPHSHPILTLNSRWVDDDDRLLATYLHEQCHWWLTILDADAFQGAIRWLHERWPVVPTEPPTGARNEHSTYLHLLVCWLEYDALRTLRGPAEARRIVGLRQHYTWIYSTVVADDAEFAAFARRLGLVPRPPPGRR